MDNNNSFTLKNFSYQFFILVFIFLGFPHVLWGQAGNAQYIPILVNETKTVSSGVGSLMTGLEDYLALLNIRDGGINKIPLVFQKCPTQLQNEQAVQCFEKMKGRGAKGAPVFLPLTKSMNIALSEAALIEKIPLVTIGMGRSLARDGTVFPFEFPLITTDYSQITAQIKFIGIQEGSLGRLSGKTILNLHGRDAQAPEAVNLLDAMAKKYQFKIVHIGVKNPGNNQTKVWERIANSRIDWVLNRTEGLMCVVALKEANRINFPRNRMIGSWNCASEEDVTVVGGAAKGYITSNFHGVGIRFPVIQQIVVYMYQKGKPKFLQNTAHIGTVNYNRGVILGILVTQAIGIAQEKVGYGPVGGEEMAWALERLNLTKEKIKSLGAEGLISPIQTSFKNHEGRGEILMQQWDGYQWKRISGWISPLSEIVQKEMEKYLKEYTRISRIIPRTKPWPDPQKLY